MTTPRRADGTGDVTLPAGAEEVAGTVPDGWRRLERRSHAVAAAYSLAVATPVAVAIVRGMTGAGVAVELIVAACAGAALLILAGAVVYDVLRWRATEYRVTGERVELRSGVVQRRHRSVPRERVRTADVTADPVRRVLGLAVLKIGTGEHAGEGASELSLDPISRREAERLRALLLHAPDRAPGAARPDAARSPGTAYSADGASSPPAPAPCRSRRWRGGGSGWPR
ncbi:PH domain-containing protein [Thermocatellispora tengchongensis]|uniref:PH domain-containing protein n=1 Tax=Thermocatellispora tengchongensis TaxID=1073253 RepID=UPI00362CBFA9